MQPPEIHRIFFNGSMEIPAVTIQFMATKESLRVLGEAGTSPRPTIDEKIWYVKLWNSADELEAMVKFIKIFD